MSKGILLVIIGSLVALIPFLGFPRVWLEVFFVIAGISTIIIGLLLRHERMVHEWRETPERRTDVYVESNGRHDVQDRETEQQDAYAHKRAPAEYRAPVFGASATEHDEVDETVSSDQRRGQYQLHGQSQERQNAKADTKADTREDMKRDTREYAPKPTDDMAFSQDEEAPEIRQKESSVGEHMNVRRVEAGFNLEPVRVVASTPSANETTTEAPKKTKKTASRKRAARKAARKKTAVTKHARKAPARKRAAKKSTPDIPAQEPAIQRMSADPSSSNTRAI